MSDFDRKDWDQDSKGPENIESNRKEQDPDRYKEVTDAEKTIVADKEEDASVIETEAKAASDPNDNGQLIPDELMIDILASVYDSFGKEHKGVIFDGFPRTIPQAEALKKMLAERGHKVAAMIELSVPEDELMARLINRGKESGRSDDNEETIKKRLNVYHTQTSPLIDWYEKEGIHHHIEGLGTVDEIFARVCNVIDNL